MWFMLAITLGNAYAMDGNFYVAEDSNVMQLPNGRCVKDVRDYVAIKHVRMKSQELELPILRVQRFPIECPSKVTTATTDLYSHAIMFSGSEISYVFRQPSHRSNDRFSVGAVFVGGITLNDGNDCRSARHAILHLNMGGDSGIRPSKINGDWRIAPCPT